MNTLFKIAKKKEEWDGGQKGQASLSKMLKDKKVSRDQYVKAGVKDEDNNVKKKAAERSKFLGLSVPSHPVSNMVNKARKMIESKEHQQERFGKAHDRFNPKSKNEGK